MSLSAGQSISSAARMVCSITCRGQFNRIICALLLCGCTIRHPTTPPRGTSTPPTPHAHRDGLLEAGHHHVDGRPPVRVDAQVPQPRAVPALVEGELEVEGRGAEEEERALGEDEGDAGGWGGGGRRVRKGRGRSMWEAHR